MDIMSKEFEAKVGFAFATLVRLRTCRDSGAVVNALSKLDFEKAYTVLYESVFPTQNWAEEIASRASQLAKSDENRKQLLKLCREACDLGLWLAVYNFAVPDTEYEKEIITEVREICKRDTDAWSVVSSMTREDSKLRRIAVSKQES